MGNWIAKSNRTYHFAAGFAAALLGTIVGAAEVGTAMECKDCQADKANKGLPPWKWTYRNFDWLDWTATMLGGVLGQAVQVGVALLVWKLSK